MSRVYAGTSIQLSFSLLQLLSFSIVKSDITAIQCKYLLQANMRKINGTLKNDQNHPISFNVRKRGKLNSHSIMQITVSTRLYILQLVFIISKIINLAVSSTKQILLFYQQFQINGKATTYWVSQNIPSDFFVRWHQWSAVLTEFI